MLNTHAPRTAARAATPARLRRTEMRNAVLDAVRAASPHALSAKQIYETLLAQGFDLGLDVVYRALRRMDQEGAVWQQRRSDGVMCWQIPVDRAGDLCRFTCSRCNFSWTFADPALNSQITDAARRHGLAAVQGAASIQIACACGSGCNTPRPALT